MGVLEILRSVARVVRMDLRGVMEVAAADEPFPLAGLESCSFKCLDERRAGVDSFPCSD